MGTAAMTAIPDSTQVKGLIAEKKATARRDKSPLDSPGKKAPFSRRTCRTNRGAK